MAPILHASACPQCGGGGGDGGSCADGEECLPSNFIDPDDCPACSCSADSYLPYCITPNATDADTLILSLSPFGYYPLVVDAADVSGNGHDATSGIGTSTFVGPITSKGTGALQETNGAGVTYPAPTADMGNPAEDWAVAMVLQVDAYDSGAGGATSLDGGFPFLSWCGGSPPKMGITMGGTGHLVPWFDSNFGRLGNYQRSRDVLFAIGEPHVLIVNAPIAVNALGTVEFWIDGVLVMTAQREGTGTDGSAFVVGRIPGGGPFFGGMNFTYSNMGTWDRSLTEAEVIAISEALIDASIVPTAWVPG